MTTVTNTELTLTHDHNKKILSQLGRVALAAVALCVGLALSSAPAVAQQPAPPGLQPPGGPTSKVGHPGAAQTCAFTLTAPTLNALLPAQSNVIITWTGCPANWHVNLSLIDITTWQNLVTFASNIPNTGSRTWTLPLLDCSHTYQFYIAEVANQTWTYGPKFKVKCGYDIKLVKAKTGTNYTITLLNLGSPIVGPAKITILDSLPCGVKVTGGSGGGVSGGTWTMSPGAGTLGPAPITLTYTIGSGTTVSTGQQIALFSINAVVQIPKNCATATILSVNGVPVTETDTTNNTDCAQ